MIKYISLTSLLTISIISLSSCEGVKEDLGLGRTVPDEFAVIKRAPLEIPDSLILPKPQPGVSRPQEISTDEEAVKTVLGNKAQDTKQISQTEKQLLQKAGADQAQKDIRTIVNQETATFEHKNISVAKKLLNIGKDKPVSEIVDAKKEAQRIKENLESGRPITEGETPSILE